MLKKKKVKLVFVGILKIEISGYTNVNLKKNKKKNKIMLMSEETDAGHSEDTVADEPRDQYVP